VKVLPGRAFEVPDTAGVTLHDILTVNLGAGQIDHVVNDTGGPATTGDWCPVNEDDGCQGNKGTLATSLATTPGSMIPLRSKSCLMPR
jgi:hypothetical protein